MADKRVLGATNHIFCLQLRQGNRLWGRLEERAQSPKLWDCPQLLWNTGHKPLPSPTHRKVSLVSKPSVNSQKLLQQGSIPQTSISIHLGLLKLKAESAAICPHLLQAGHRRTTSTLTAQGSTPDLQLGACVTLQEEVGEIRGARQAQQVAIWFSHRCAGEALHQFTLEYFLPCCCHLLWLFDYSNRDVFCKGKQTNKKDTNKMWR